MEKQYRCYSKRFPKHYSLGSLIRLVTFAAVVRVVITAAKETMFRSDWLKLEKKEKKNNILQETVKVGKQST